MLLLQPRFWIKSIIEWVFAAWFLLTFDNRPFISNLIIAVYFLGYIYPQMREGFRELKRKNKRSGFPKGYDPMKW